MGFMNNESLRALLERIKGSFKDIEDKTNLKITEFVSDLEGQIEQIKEESVGEKTSQGGEIFNDYENNKALSTYSSASGYNTTASGEYAHSEGNSTTASHIAAHSEGQNTKAAGKAAHAEGLSTEAIEEASHTEGNKTKATGINGHAEGRETIASGFNSHVEGLFSQASGKNSHAEGANAYASGENSHAEGSNTNASKYASHAEGTDTKASQNQAHAEGWSTEASGYHSHAEGSETLASGNFSHAGGKGTIAVGTAQTAIGKYNFEDSNALFIVGNGISKKDRQNAFVVNNDGSATIQTPGTENNNVVNYKQLKDYVSENGKSPWDAQSEMLFSTGDVKITNHVANDSESNGEITVGYDYAHRTGQEYSIISNNRISCNYVADGVNTTITPYGIQLDNGISASPPTISFESLNRIDNVTNKLTIYVDKLTYNDKSVTWLDLYNTVEGFEKGSYVGPQGPQGIQGIQGEKGEPGNDYVLTEADKNEITNMVLQNFVNVSEVGQ